MVKSPSFHALSESRALRLSPYWGGMPRGCERRASRAPLAKSKIVFVFLGQLFDIVWRPINDIHSQMQAHARQHFLDLVQGLAAKVWRAQHLGFGFLDQITDIDDVVV